MKKFLLVTLISFLSSCSTTKPFNREMHCTKAARDFVETERNKKAASTLSREELLNAASVLVGEVKPKVQKCYKVYYDSEKAPADFNVCTTLKVSEQGKLQFLEIEDAANPLDQTLKKCLMSAFQSQNYSDLKSALIDQPIFLHKP